MSVPKGSRSREAPADEIGGYEKNGKWDQEFDHARRSPLGAIRASRAGMTSVELQSPQQRPSGLTGSGLWP